MLISRNNMLLKNRHPKRRQTFSDITNELLINADTHESFQLPATNIKEGDTAYQIELAMPGMDRNSIKIYVRGDNFHVEAEKLRNEKNENYTHQEFELTRYNRTFQLPSDVRRAQINAKYEEGILYISLPKNESVVTEEQIQMISIN